jgi:superfamily I DNA/RNA helicase
VTTFDAWCLEFYRAHINSRAPWDAENKQFDFGAIHQAVWEKTRASTGAERLFDFVLVDEGQDLDVRSFEILKAVSQHVTVFMDHKQQLYETGADEQGILNALGLRRCNLTLLEAYRCSPYIVRVAASFLRDPAEREAFVRQHPPIKTSRQTPLLYLASNADDEREHLIEMVRNRIDKNDRMAILFPTKRHVYGYARALQEAGLEVEVPGKARRRGSRSASGPELPDIDFSTPLPKLMPYPSAKGLTFDTVLMPRLIPGLFGKIEFERLERWLFVGITRATQWVYFSTINDNRFMFLDRFQALESEKQVAIKFSGGLLPAGASGHARVAADEETEEEDHLSDLF